MNQGVKTIIYPVSDLAGAKKLFSALLGAEPLVDQPYYVGWKVGGEDIGLDPNGHKAGLTGPLAYYHVDDIKASLHSLVETGAQILQDVRDVGGGKLTASVKDADGNSIGLIQESSK
jgi:predicted enzyme related to lactoylglutathione lyase